MNSKLESFEQRINANQREISRSQLTAIQQSAGADTYSFRKKGHEQQSRLNNKVLETLSQAGRLVQEAEQSNSDINLTSARNKIAEGITILNHRQKCIKLADSSEHGWKVVQEYEANPLADDSDDEKRISRAHYHADRRVRQERRDRQKRITPYQQSARRQLERLRWALRVILHVEQGLVSVVGKPAIGSRSAEW